MRFEAPSRYRTRVYPQWVRRVVSPPFKLLTPKGRRARLGIRYENKVHTRLEEIYGLDYWASQWFAYSIADDVRYCQPDGLLYLREKNLFVIVEIKYSHCTEAYWQLENLYVPVMKKWMEQSRLNIATAEVVKWYDPAVAYPRKPSLVESLGDCRTDKFSVHILNR